MDKGLSETRTILQTLRYECLWWPYKTHKRKNQLTENPLITENPLRVTLYLF